MKRGHHLDLMLINPGSRTEVYQSLGTDLAAIENPIWAGLMATFCRRFGLSVEIVDGEAEGLSSEEVAERVAYHQPALAAIVAYGHQPSASTQIMPAARRVSTAIKAYHPHQKVILVGGHVAALPDRSLREESTDFVGSGEALYTLVLLVRALKSGASTYTKVPGLYYRENDRICHTPDVPLVADLDRMMRTAAWDLLPMDRYRAHNWHCLDGRSRTPYAAIYTTLGCPYHCSFCCIQAPFKSGERASKTPHTRNSYRYWHPDTVISTIDHLVDRYGIRNIKIADEMFVLNRKHVEAICDRIIERGYDLNIWAYTRVDTIKDGMLDKLKTAGVNWLAFGIEAGSERVRSNVDKPFNQHCVHDVIDQVRAAGINVIGNYIFGLPEDDMDSMQDTLDLATSLNCEFSNFYSAMAYPGSSLYSMAIEQGAPLPTNWTGYSQHSRDCQPLPTYYLTAKDVLQFRDHAFLTYYANPRYLTMIETKFGRDTKNRIIEMTSHRLQRDLIDGILDVPLTTLPRSTPHSTPGRFPLDLALPLAPSPIGPES